MKTQSNITIRQGDNGWVHATAPRGTSQEVLKKALADHHQTDMPDDSAVCNVEEGNGVTVFSWWIFPTAV